MTENPNMVFGLYNDLLTATFNHWKMIPHSEEVMQHLTEYVGRAVKLGAVVEVKIKKEALGNMETPIEYARVEGDFLIVDIPGKPGLTLEAKFHNDKPALKFKAKNLGGGYFYPNEVESIGIK